MQFFRRMKCRLKMFICLGLLLSTASGCESGMLSPPVLPVDEIFTNTEERDFVKAIVAGDMETIKRMVADGMDVNIKGKYGITPLYFAIHFDHTDVFVFLLQQGADPNVQFDVPPSFLKRHHILSNSLMFAIVNDINPEYFIKSLENGLEDYPRILRNFTSLPAGSLRNQKMSLDEAVPVDTQKLQCLLETRKDFLDDKMLAETCLSRLVGFKRYRCAAMLIENNMPVTPFFLKDLFFEKNGANNLKLPIASKTDLENLCKYLENYDAMIFFSLKEILQEKKSLPASEGEIEGHVTGPRQKSTPALQQLADELNLKRGVMVHKSIADKS